MNARFGLKTGERNAVPCRMPGATVKVVLVDDSRSALFALQSSLSNIEGIELIPFMAPEAALTYCLANPVDLIFIDYMMPGHTGIDVIKALKQSPDYNLVPIVMVTAA
jgi:putative two-component system response regulator